MLRWEHADDMGRTSLPKRWRSAYHQPYVEHGLTTLCIFGKDLAIERLTNHRSNQLEQRGVLPVVRPGQETLQCCERHFTARWDLVFHIDRISPFGTNQRPYVAIRVGVEDVLTSCHNNLLWRGLVYGND